MDRDEASIIVNWLWYNWDSMSKESGDTIRATIDTEQRRILKELVDALPPKAGEVGNAVPHKEEQ